MLTSGQDTSTLDEGRRPVSSVGAFSDLQWRAAVFRGPASSAPGEAEKRRAAEDKPPATEPPIPSDAADLAKIAAAKSAGAANPAAAFEAEAADPVAQAAAKAEAAREALAASGGGSEPPEEAEETPVVDPIALAAEKAAAALQALDAAGGSAGESAPGPAVPPEAGLRQAAYDRAASGYQAAQRTESPPEPPRILLAA